MDKTCGRCRTAKPVAAFPKREKGLFSSWCRECHRARYREWYLENRTANLARNAAYRSSNKDRVRAYNAAWVAANKEIHRAMSLAWRERNAERVKENSRRYSKENAARRASIQRLRQAQLKQAMPPWANDFFIEEIYRLASLRSKLTGIKWHVDHIIPLRNPLVCGLHCEANLRVVPASVNARKHNKFVMEQNRG